MSTVIYTVVTGGYDDPKPVPAFTDARLVMVTDGPGAPGWERMPLLWAGDARRASRHAKCMPHLYFNAERSIYFDGAFEIRRDPRWLLDYVEDADLAAFAHHGGHKSHHDERNFYQRLHGYVPDDVEAHYQRMVDVDFPNRGEFWACGVLARRHSQEVDDWGEAWWERYITGSQNDQLAFVEALEDVPVTIATIPGVNIAQHDFPWIRHRG